MNAYSVAEVSTMLEKNGLGAYVASFKAKGIDGKKLCALAAADLATLGVANEAHQKALLQRIELYRDAVAEAAPPAPESKPSPTEVLKDALAKCQSSMMGCAAPMVEGMTDCMDAVKSKLTGGGGGAIPKPGARGRRQQVIAPSAKVPDDWKPPVFKKTPDEGSFLKQSLSTNRLFKNLNASDIDVLVKAFKKSNFKKGENIITQGDAGDKASTFYLLAEGTCDITIKGKGSVMKATRGIAFGELALLHNAPRAATVTAEEDVMAWCVDSTTFKAILMGKSKDDAKDYSGFISEVPLLKALKKAEVQRLLDGLTEVNFQPGDVIIKEGDAGDAFFIIRDGEVKATKKSQKDEVSRRLKRSDFFGELALLSSAKRAVTITATAPTAALRLERDAFERILGPLKASKEMADSAAGQGRK